MKIEISSSRRKTNNGLYTSLIFISLLLTLCTLALSAYIRLAQSGLDCTPWPTCYGQISATPEQQGIAVLTTAGAEMSHKGARVAHRFIASTLGITVTLILLLSIRRRFQGEPGILAAFLLMAATLFLAVLGYSTPTRTLPWITLGNLGGGMLMAGLLWWLGQGSVGVHRTPLRRRRHRLMPIIGLILLTLQIMSGAWVSANFAATACADQLLCAANWQELSQALNIKRELSISTTGSILPELQVTEAIVFLHRLFALISTLFLVVLALQLLPLSKPLAATAKTMLVFLLLEVALGVLSTLYQLPLALVTLHNLIAALLVLCLVNLLHHSIRP